LPPSYGHSPNNAEYTRSYSAAGGGEEIKRNLFGSNGVGNSETQMASDNHNGSMDDSGDFVMEDASSNSRKNSRPNTPSSSQRRNQRAPSNSNFARTPSSSAAASPRHNNGYYSPANRGALSVATSASDRSGAAPSTFMNRSLQCAYLGNH